MKAVQMQGVHKGRTMLTENGKPVMIQMAMRRSTTAPARYKAVFGAIVEQDGVVGVAPLPFAQPTVGVNGETPSGFTPEFRLDFN